MAENMAVSRATRNSRTSNVPRTSHVPRISNTPRARNTRTSGPPAARPENRRLPQQPQREPLLARVRVWLAGKRSKLPLVRRIGYWCLQLLAAAGIALGVSAAGRLLLRHLETAPAFSTTNIEIKGATQLGPSEIQRIAGLAIGRNVFRVDAEEAAARLLAEPWIEEASVQRRLPGTYQIQIKERRALALLSAGDLYLVGEDGVAFKKLSRGDPADLPIITGLPVTVIEKDKRAAASVLLQAASLLRDYVEAGLSRREPISEVRIEPDDSLSVYVGADATFVRFGKAPYRPKLRRLREVFGQLAAQRARAQYVYLDNDRRPDRVTVRLR